ncbi:MAG: glycosyltransferase family 4 protein [Clostridia bacterium]|nr:glycosyltransferase family 4 protein [Clostridia bacterium]
MKKVLFITNIEVPYRVEFFNELSKKCNLMVLYEREESKNRDKDWTNSKKKSFKYNYLKGIKIGNENSFDLRVLKYLFDKKYDEIIIGCINSPIQIFSILIMNLFHKRYSINLDGDAFIEENGCKNKIKRFLLKKADKYYISGFEYSKVIKKIMNVNNVFTYRFSSMNKEELTDNKELVKKDKGKRQDYFLIVGQFYRYKGLDVALEVADRLKNYKFKFVGMGNRTDILKNNVNARKMKNVELVSFLSKEKLNEEYIKCKALILPSRKECWGLVVNEAASFGTPIISTYGSGAAKEFLNNEYSMFLAKPGDSEDLYNTVVRFIQSKEKNRFSEYLMDKSSNYSIENSVHDYLKGIRLNEK